MLPRVAQTIAGLARVLRCRMAELGRDVDAGRRGARGRMPCSATPALAATYRPPRRGRPKPPATDRAAQIDAARAVWREGFVAEAICDYLAGRRGGRRLGSSATGGSCRARTWPVWSATYEETLSYEYHGWTVHKTASMEPGAGAAAGAVDPEGHSIFGAMDPNGRRVRSHGDRGHEARLCRPRGLLRRSRLTPKSRWITCSPTPTPPSAGR